eukprot:COSAG05_NODE_3009_length_2418_cov_1.500216_5_plen_47_part_00
MHCAQQRGGRTGIMPMPWPCDREERRVALAVDIVLGPVAPAVVHVV